MTHVLESSDAARRRKAKKMKSDFTIID